MITHRSLVCAACQSTAHHIQQCPQIARFDVEAHLREQNLHLYDAIGSALACLRNDSVDGAIFALETAMKGTTMTTTDDTPPKDAPGDDCPDHGPHADDECPKC